MPNQAEQKVVISQFAGLNTADTPASIQDSELVECLNFNLSSNGDLVRRTGFTELRTNITVDSAARESRVIGYFKINYAIDRIIFAIGANLYGTDDGVNWFLIMEDGASGITHGLQYLDTFYMIRDSDEILEYDGSTTPSPIFGSPHGTHAYIHKDRMFVVDTESLTPSRIYYSDSGDFSTAGWASLANFVDILPGDGQVVTGFLLFRDNFFIFKTRSIYILYVTPDIEGWFLRNVSTSIGSTSRHTLKEHGGYIYFTAYEGVYRTDGYGFEEISRPIANLWQAPYTVTEQWNIDYAVVWEGKYIVVSHFRDPDENDERQRWLVYHFDAGGWTTWQPFQEQYDEFPYFETSWMIEVVASDVLYGVWMGSPITHSRITRFGDIKYEDTSNTMSSGPPPLAEQSSDNITCRVLTKEFNFGQPAHAKEGSWMGADVEYPTGIVDLSLYNIISVDSEGSSNPAAREYTDAAETWVKRPFIEATGPGHFRVWQVLLTLDALDNQDHAVIVHNFCMGIFLVEQHLERTLNT